MAKRASDMGLKAGAARGGRGRPPLRFAVVVARFNAHLTSRLLKTVKARLAALGCKAGGMKVHEVPGAFELGIAAKELASTGAYDAVICLGAVIRGETSHYDLVCRAAADGILRAGMDTGVPAIFGVITCEDEAQALARCSGGNHDAGRHAAEAAVSMALLLRKVRHGA